MLSHYLHIALLHFFYYRECSLKHVHLFRIRVFTFRLYFFRCIHKSCLSTCKIFCHHVDGIVMIVPMSTIFSYDTLSTFNFIFYLTRKCNVELLLNKTVSFQNFSTSIHWEKNELSFDTFLTHIFDFIKKLFFHISEHVFKSIAIFDAMNSSEITRSTHYIHTSSLMLQIPFFDH